MSRIRLDTSGAELQELLGGPVDTVEELVSRVKKVALSEEELCVLPLLLGHEVRYSLRALEALLYHPGATYHSAITALETFHLWKTTEEELQEMVEGAPHAKDALYELKWCPLEIGPYRCYYANVTRGISRVEREIFDALLLDRKAEIELGTYGPSESDVFSECRKMSQMLVAEETTDTAQ